MDNSILDTLMDHLDRATRYENSIWSLCIFHTDSRPSFMVHADYYNCQSCGAHGKTSKLLEKLEGHIAQPSVSQFNNPWSAWTRKESLSDVLKNSWVTLKNRPSNYLIKRGVSEEIQIKLGLGIRDNWITFPITDKNNVIVGAVARAGEGNNSTSKYVVPNGQNPNLIYVPSWKRLEKQNKIYVTFGIIDAVSLYICGVAACSTTNGKRLSEIYVFNDYRKQIKLIPDLGEERDAKMIAAKLGWRGSVMKMNYPPDTKDCNDILVKYPERLQYALNMA